MRAAFVKRPGKVKISAVPIGRARPGEALVKVDLCGICGSDLLEAKAWATDWKRFGHEMVGTVAETGPGVASVRPGDRVVIALSAECGACAACVSGNPRRCSELLLAQQGGFAEYVTVAHERLLHKLPADLPADIACFAEPLSVVLDAFEAARLEAGQRVLAVGGGFLAVVALLAAKARGAHVEGVLTRAAGRAMESCLADAGGSLFLWRTRFGRTVGAPADFEGRISSRPERLVVIHTAPAKYVALYAHRLPFDSSIVNLGLSAVEKDNVLALDASKSLFRRLQLLSGFPVPCLSMGEAVRLLADNVDLFSRVPTRRASLEELPAIIDGSARRDGKVLIQP